jgi:Protein of unknown function (DUF2892)
VTSGRGVGKRSTKLKEENQMKANMGTIDKVIRIALALLVGALYFTGMIGGTVAIILGALAVVFVLTSLVSFCPLYLPLGISTRGRE